MLPPSFLIILSLYFYAILCLMAKEMFKPLSCWENKKKCYDSVIENIYVCFLIFGSWFTLAVDVFEWNFHMWESNN